MYKLLAISILIIFCPRNSKYKTLPYSASKTKLPFVKEYKRTDKSVLVFGSYHTNDSTDAEIAAIEQKLNEFNPDIILYEGDHIDIEDTRNKSIGYYYEMGLVRWLAKEQNIPDLNLEPPTGHINKKLLRKYSTDELLLATILGQNMIYIKQNSKADFEALYPTLIRDMQADGLVLAEEQKTIAHFYTLYQEFYDEPFDPETFDYTTVEIAYNKTKLNKIIRRSASIRDQFMLRRIDSCLEYHDKIYVQIGGRHAIVWQPALKHIVAKHSE